MTSEERTIKEYPNSTRWIEGRKIVGVGNLVLTNRRLIFLHQVALDDQQLESIRKMAQQGHPADKMADFALNLHKKNFQIPLTSVVTAKVGLLTLLPFPRPCLRVIYEKNKGDLRMVSFMFTIPILKGFFQTEIADVLTWVSKIKKAVNATSQL